MRYSSKKRLQVRFEDNIGVERWLDKDGSFQVQRWESFKEYREGVRDEYA